MEQQIDFSLFFVYTYAIQTRYPEEYNFVRKVRENRFLKI